MIINNATAGVNDGGSWLPDYKPITPSKCVPFNWAYVVVDSSKKIIIKVAAFECFFKFFIIGAVCQVIYFPPAGPLRCPTLSKVSDTSLLIPGIQK